MFATVIRDQAKALDILSTHEFPVQDFLHLLDESSGTVIVTGMGKSGHIARKIASTMASLGTPAHFLHAADASHGDLGRIRPRDVILVLSKSGQTKELRPIIEYAHLVDASIVAITQDQPSYLRAHADVVFLVPTLEEVGLAPTTSTTMMLVIGDALAMEIAHDLGFTDDDFFDRHPGGELGLLSGRKL